MARPYYAIQPAFTGGEISEDVAARIDLDKYQLSLLQAQNTVIKPYGSVKKRSGSQYCGTTKNNGKAILRRFEFTTELSYMLEFGNNYLRIWKNGAYLNVELATPFAESELNNIRTIQSVDVMYICTGSHPVYKLMRYAENNWQLNAVNWYLAPFEEINSNKSLKITPSGTSGSVTLTATAAAFTSNSVGDYIKLSQRVEGVTESISATSAENPKYSSAMTCAGSWKVISHGTWTGKLQVQISYDNGSTWQEYRSYSSSDDYNPTESGTLEENARLRLKAEITSGTCNADLSRFTYNVEGYAKITAYSSTTSVTASVIKDFGATTATPDFYFSSWGASKGYPYTATFFQDRLVFGGSPKHPQRIWMSKTGDYENFEVEKESGTVTDDSAVTADLLSLKAYQINHLYSGTDLIIMTEGNTWTISGSETVTPSNITPRNQESFGANHIEPIKVGSRLVYVQKRGNTVRDVGYSFNSDSYTGVDLTLLAKHLVQGVSLTDGTYAQEPDSCAFFVRSDGAMNCLTYVPDQKVFAWTHFNTDGAYEAVAAITQGTYDRVYVIVRRTIGGATKRYIEVFDIDRRSDSQQDYHMLDSYVEKNGTASTVISGLSHLNGKKVQVLADGYYYDDKTYTVSSGQITLPEAVKRAVVGLPYQMTIEQANFEAGNTDTGTLQGRNKVVTTAILRMIKSYGGSIGPNASAQNNIIYDPDRIELTEQRLFSGDKEVVLGKGGYDRFGRVYIKQNEPYPFVLSAIIREVTL